MAFTVKKIEIDSTLELLADHFNIELEGTELFVNAAKTDRFTLPLGLIDQNGLEQTITQVKDGVIDEYELVITPKEQVVYLRGRDPSALILDRVFEKNYIKAVYEATPQGAHVHSADTQAQIEAAQKLLTDEGVPFEVGSFNASQVAREIATKLGLVLAWQVRDYVLATSFVAQGRAAETLRKLIEPWTIVEPFRADVFIQGKTLVVRHRRLPTDPNPIPDSTFTVADTRRGTIRIRRRKTRKVGRLLLQGRSESVGPSGVPSNILIVIDADREVEIEQETAFTAPVETPSGSGVQVNQLFKTLTTTTYKMPAQTVIKQTKESFGPHLVERTEMVNEYRATSHGPLLDKAVTMAHVFNSDAGRLVLQSTTTKVPNYDANGFMVGENILVTTFDASGEVSDQRLTIKTLYDIAPQMVEEITEEYSIDPGAGHEGNPAFWTLVRRDSHISGGRRPGGGGRVGTNVLGKSLVDRMEPVKIDVVLSTDEDAVPVSYSNQHLSLPDLEFLKSLFEAANNFNWEYEFLFDGVAMPWLQRGNVLRITNVTDPAGGPIPLPDMTITEVRLSYDETKVRAEFIARIRAFAWGA